MIGSFVSKIHPASRSMLRDLRTVITEHGVGFSGSCLAVHENCATDALERAHHYVLARVCVNVRIDYVLAVASIYHKCHIRWVLHTY